jgi:hypothetical protein
MHWIASAIYCDGREITDTFYRGFIIREVMVNTKGFPQQYYPYSLVLGGPEILTIPKECKRRGPPEWK